MTIIYLAVAWFIGLWLGANTGLSLWQWLLPGLVSLVAAVLFRRQPVPRRWLLVLAFLALGAARYTAARQTIDQGQVAAYNNRSEVTLTGLVVDDPIKRDQSQRLRFQTESLIEADGRSRPVEGVVLLLAPPFREIAYGMRLQVTGQLEAPPPAGEFNYADYLARQGIYSQMIFPEITVLTEGAGNPIMQAIYRFRQQAREIIGRLLPEPHAALLTGILLGDDSGLPVELEEQFRITGMTHVIAISGFNIAILTAILLKGARPFVGRRGSAWVAIVGLILYTILVGAGASVVRAAIMGILFVIAFRFMGRPTFAPAGLFTAAIVMALVDPDVPWDVGFQLSFAATLGLMLYLQPFRQWTEATARRIVSPEIARRLVRFFSDIILATLAAMLLVNPIIAYHFGQLSLISPLANLFVLPVQPGIMAFGILSVLTAMVFEPLGRLLSYVAWFFLNYTINRVRFFAGLPGAALAVSVSPAGVAAIFALIFGLTWWGWQGPDGRQQLRERLRPNLSRGATLGAGLLVTILVASWALSQPDGRLHVAFLDVGQGDATLIQTPSGRQILVDGGAYPSMLFDQLGRLIPFWDRELDLVIASHSDSDHVAGLPGLFDRYRIGRLITNGQSSDEEAYQALLDAAAGENTPVHQTQAGEVMVVDDGLRLEILNPGSGQWAVDGDQNDHSVALRLVYGNFSLLLTGDAGQVAEREMMAAGRPLSAVVYKAGHHGAKSSSGAGFLEMIRPQYVVISAGEENRYGHPHEELLQRVAEVGAVVFRTDDLGTIEVITDGEVLWWEAGGD